MLIEKSQYRKYCWNYPPKDYDAEFKSIEEKLKVYSQNKICFLKDYLEKNTWIAVYLFLEERNIMEIESIANSVISSSTESDIECKIAHNGRYNYLRECRLKFITVFLQRISEEVSNAGGVIQYLNLRYKFQYSDYYDNRFSNNVVDEERLVLNFLGKIVQQIEEIERVEPFSKYKIKNEITKKEQAAANIRTPLDEKLKLNGIKAVDIISRLRDANIIQLHSSLDDTLNQKNNAMITISVKDPHEWAWSIIRVLVDNKKSNFNPASLRGAIKAICEIFDYMDDGPRNKFSQKKFSEKLSGYDYREALEEILNLK